MRFKQSAFTSDHLQLTRWELVKLFFGFTVREQWQAIEVSVKPATEFARVYVNRDDTAQDVARKVGAAIDK